MLLFRAVYIWGFILFLMAPVFGQNLVPNPSFEAGTNLPLAWSLSHPGEGQWEEFGRTSGRSVSVSGTGSACGRRWQSATMPVQPGLPYLFRFWGMSSNLVNPNSLSCISGFDLVTRDVKLTSQWSPISYITVLPNDAVNPVLRLGQCGINGKLIFDDVEVLPVIPLHTLVQGYLLGAGESFSPGKYSFKTLLSGSNANYARTLHEHSALFGTDGWVVETGEFVTYRHHFEGLFFTNAQIKITAKYQSGELLVDLSTDGSSWIEAGRYVSPTPGSIGMTFNVAVPGGLLPAESLFVRIRSVGGFWVTEYQLDADLPGIETTAQGNTWFFERQQPVADVQPVSVLDTSGGFVMQMELRNGSTTNRQISILEHVEGSAGTRERLVTLLVLAGTTNVCSLELPSAGAGQNVATIQARNTADASVILTGEITFNLSWFRDSSYGSLLPGGTNMAVWWCEPTYKVNRDRFLPTQTNDAVLVSAARNEYEPFQLVIRPKSALSNVVVTVGDLTYLNGGGIPAISSSNIEVSLVEYVPVTELFGSAGELGDYPDPLPPLLGPFAVPANANQPLWFTVYVPKNATAGDYQGSINIQSDSEEFSVPVRLRVFDFALSDVTHTKTAYGLDFIDIWEQCQNYDEVREVWDLYMQNFRKHRISPFRPQSFDRITFSVATEPVTIDFSRFDAAMSRYLDDFDFNCFNWDEERYSGTVQLGGYQRFTPEYRSHYARLMPPIMAHLREKGWFDKAYSFWFDEPLPKHYPFVKEGLELIQQAAPGLRRMLTIYPDPPLYESVDIWSPIFVISTFISTHHRWLERQQLGEELWWYVASAPIAPLPNNFTDQPAFYPRIRAWMAEKYGVTGEIYWQVAWPYGEGYVPWNPWTNAMSYSGGGGPWGNGNGLLLYPPAKTLSPCPIIAGPVNSLRWEMLREAQEDREYFWLLKELVARAEVRLGPTHPKVVEGQAAREAALNLITSPLVYEQNPEELYQQRLRMAAAIEALEDGAPMIVRDPKTQAVALNQTVTLRTEALGWPLPQYQWQRNGSNLSGTTGPVLTLSNINPAHVGEYCVVASNTFGAATSAVARLSGYWEATPQILDHPKSLVRKAGSAAVFAVTAVSSNALGYAWLFNAAPLPGATNATLLLTNLSFAHTGDYQVVITNVAGAVTSLVAGLTVPLLQTNFTLISTGAVWRYQDQGLNLDTAWQATNYSDAGWPSGPAQLGYGDGDEQTVVSFGADPNLKHITTYFRHSFQNPFGNAPAHLVARMLRDDGAVAYLNGTEVYRSQNLPNGTISHNTLATGGFWDSAEVTGANESIFFPLSILVTSLKPGQNVLAVEVHQYSPTSDDLGFDFELVGTWFYPPEILIHPAATGRRPGQSALFTVTAASAAPLSYQWRFNGAPIPAATNATFVRAELTSPDAGAYGVEVRNSAGAVISAPANLTITPLPSLQGSWGANGSGFELNLPADSATLTVLASTNLSDWTELLSLPPQAGPVVFTDTNTMQLPYRFYRLRVDP
jgi:hypothetical protein